MTQYFHGGRAMIAHSGLCLTTDFRAAVAYSEGRGDKVFACDLDLSSLTVERVEVTREMVDSDSYPGDSRASRAAYLADGVDVLVYRDCDPAGRTTTTYRLLSDAALAMVEGYEVDEA